MGSRIRTGLIAAIAGGVVALSTLAAINLNTTRLTRDRWVVGVFQGWAKIWPFERGALAPYYAWPILAGVGLVGPVQIEVEPGIRFELDPGDMVDRNLFVGGEWEKEEWEFVKSHLPVGGTFIDVGAHIGSYSLRGARRVGEHGRVVSVEPNPVTLQKLRWNIVSSGIGNISVQPFACSDKPARLKLFAPTATNTGTASLSLENVKMHHSSGNMSWDVDAVTLDSIVEREGLTQVNVIKVDTEGADTMVLRGARKTLATMRPAVLVETSDSQLRNMGSSVAELRALLEELGYRLAGQSDMNSHYVPKEK